MAHGPARSATRAASSRAETGKSRIVQLVKSVYVGPHGASPGNQAHLVQRGANLALVLETVGEGGERVLIERRGKAPVALVSVDDLLRFQMLEALQSRTADSR